MEDIMQEKWDSLHGQKRFRPKYPSEVVVQFLFRNFERDGKTRIMDLGCGAGRHVYFLASENIDAYGIDISKQGIEYADQWLKASNLKATLKVSSVDQIPFEDDFFDGIISYGVLYYLTAEEIKKAVGEIQRVLKPGGKGFIFVRNKEDYRYGLGDEIEKNTFIIRENDPAKGAFNENGMKMHFFEKGELFSLFKGFKNVCIDQLTETHENEIYQDSNYAVVFEK